MMRNVILVALVSISVFASAQQKVALVFSGGAAKGLAHVGVLKALEENDIPIDYILGTSMGGIIAGCYAAGLSPEQIEEIVLSEDFLRWVNGLSEKDYNYYYHQSDPNPNFLKVNLALDSTFNFQLNTTLASDVSLNFALAEITAQASAISHDNFDSLFVPLRVVAADIFTQNQVIISKGFLNDALRATQTVPFFYTPIRVDGKYLFDGGIYNNFPVDVAQHDFAPDVIIGSNVSTKIYDEYPYDKDEKLISNSLLLMLLDKSDPAEIPERGVYIQPNLSGYSSFDFGKVRALIDSGYRQTIRQMPEIKEKIQNRTSCEDVMARRNKFNNHSFPFQFDGLTFKGYNSKQRKYLKRVFHVHSKQKEPLYLDQIKHDYFKLVSENYFGNAYPNILYDYKLNKFNFQLTRRPQKNFQVDFGGVIATRDISNIFLGLNYYHFGSSLFHAYAGFQTGNFYKSVVLKTRIDLPYQFYLEPEVVFNGFNFLGNNDLLQDVSPTLLKRLDRRIALHVGLPLGNHLKAAISFAGVNNADRYINNSIFVSTDTLDVLKLKGFKTGFSISANDLNRKQYASEGRAFSITGNYFYLKEYHSPGNTSVENTIQETNHQWLRVKATAEQYFRAGWFRTGYFAEAVFSNQKPFQNYFGTIINTPAFSPLQDSRTIILEKFRAFNYVAGGIRNVIPIRKRLDIRIEGYLFKPIEYLTKGSDQQTLSSTNLTNIFFAGTAGFVLHSPIGPVSLSVNYYDDDERKLGILLHAGFLLFNKHAIDE
jgi:NTE family protein